MSPQPAPDGTCPMCGYAPSDGAPPLGSECPKCGLIFAKWHDRFRPPDPSEPVERIAVEPIAVDPFPRPAAAPAFAADDAEPEQGLARRLLAFFVTVKPQVNSLEFYFHAALLVVFVVWGCRFLLADVTDKTIMNSFMHSVNLVFHEAGHLLFRPFGRFMTIAGGSINQLVVPLVVTLALLIKNRDPFGASLGLWWLGQSFKDLAPYIFDARSLSLPLLGGIIGAENPDVHDWRNILLALNLLPYDHIVARWSDRIGSLLMVTAMVWGAFVLYREYRNVDPDYYD